MYIYIYIYIYIYLHTELIIYHEVVLLTRGHCFAYHAAVTKVIEAVPSLLHKVYSFGGVVHTNTCHLLISTKLQ